MSHLRSRRRRRAVLSTVLTVVLAVAALVLAGALIGSVLRARDAEQAALVPSPSLPASDTAPASPAPGPEPTAAAGTAPAGRPLGEVLVAAAGRFVSGDLGQRSAPEDGPAEFGGSFSNGRDVVALRAWQWPSPQAAAASLPSPPAGFAPADLDETGPVGRSAVGEYHYYERDGRAALRWTHDSYLLELTGQPGPVRELYLAYPW